MSDRLRANLLYIFLCLTWGSTWLAIKISLNGISPITGAALRFLVSGVVLVGAALALKTRFPGGSTLMAVVLVQGLLGVAVSYALIFWAELSVPSGLAAVLFATFPMFTGVVAAYAFHQERFNAANVTGLALGFAGVAAIYWSEVVRASHAAPLGVLAILGAALVSAYAVTDVKRLGTSVGPLALTATSHFSGGLMLAALALVVEHDRPIAVNATTISAIAYLGIIGSAAAFWAMFFLLRSVSATRVSLITYVTPVVAVTLGAFVAHEHLSLRSMLGAALIFAGIGLMHAKTRALPPYVSAFPSSTSDRS